MEVNEIFSVLDVIEQSIKLAELDTTAEFKVHIEKHCPGDPNDRAQYVFNKLNLKKTKLRNAVLIYVAFASLKYSIIYDKGIAEQLKPEIREHAGQILLDGLREQKIACGIMDTIDFLGKRLGEVFPFNPNDRNELTDEVSLEQI